MEEITMSLLKIKRNLNEMPLVLETKSGVLHHQDSTKPANEIIVEQQWGPHALTVDKFDDYIAISFWQLSDGTRTYRVANFNGCTDRFCRVGVTADSVLQLRIYKDKKAALCAERQIDEETTCYVLHTTQFNNHYNWNRRNLIGNEFTNSIEVHSDAEIKANAKTMTKAEATALINYTWVRVTSDLSYSNRVVYRTASQSQYNKLSKETREMLQEFFGDKWPKNLKDAPISPEKLVRFSYFKEKNSQASQHKKEELYETVLAKFFPEIEEAEPRSQIWFRDENYIGCYIKRDTSSNTNNTWYYYNYNKDDLVFLYNYKTRSRSLCRYTWSTKTVSSLIPSLSNLDTIETGPTYRRVSSPGTGSIYPAGRYEQVKSAYTSVICGGLTIKELFANTNVGFLLDNNPDFRIMDYNTRTSNGSRNGKISVGEAINTNCIQKSAFLLLASSNNPLLELLLKTQLYGLYRIALQEIANIRTTGVFLDIDQKKQPAWWTPSMPYHGKQKNLVKMFNMTLEQLRFLNARAETITEHDSYTIKNKMYVPHWMDQVINVPLSSIDMDTFQKLCKLSLELRANDLPEISLQGMSPKTIVNTFFEYDGHLQEFKDYIRARGQLQEIQKRLPENHGIFTEKMYPLKPKGGRKYIRFISGMPAQGKFEYEFGRQVQKRLITWSDFVQFYSKYPQAEFIQNEGVVLTLDSIKMLIYLHDEAAYWVSFYQDTAKEEGFKTALERIKDYTYKDEETGLEIVLPTRIEDLKREGTILHHCVGTYVDPIIGGKENIVFLRRSDMPTEPYYTVELVPPIDDRGNILDDHKKFIRQVHCVHNGCLTEADQIRCYRDYGMPVYNKTFDIIKFLLKWAKAKKDIDPSSIKTQYPALCAIR